MQFRILRTSEVAGSIRDTTKLKVYNSKLKPYFSYLETQSTHHQWEVSTHGKHLRRKTIMDGRL